MTLAANLQSTLNLAIIGLGAIFVALLLVVVFSSLRR